MKTDLLPLSAFVYSMENYTSESNNHERSVKLIYAYNHFLITRITEDMFTGENPLFPDFVKCTQKYAVENNIERSFYNFGEDAFTVTVYKESEYSKTKSGKSFCSYFHLKTIGDLIGKVDQYEDGPYTKWYWAGEVD